MHTLQVPPVARSPGEVAVGVSTQVLQFVNVETILVHSVIEEDKIGIIEVYSLFMAITMQYIPIQSSVVATEP